MFFGVLTAVVAWIVYRLLERRPAFEGELPYACASRHCRLVVAGAVGAVLAATVYLWLWSPFYRVDVGEDSVTLHYHVPLRTRTVPRAEIARVRWSGGGKSPHVVVETRDGTVFRSASASRRRDEYAALSARLAR
ncbi:MAG TPA: hypothetical protein VHG51_01285 [Longimicrobiaceae bacterium]|nr:hypothetical protein [Longimicrobiaceae bacterium]